MSSPSSPIPIGPASGSKPPALQRQRSRPILKRGGSLGNLRVSTTSPRPGASSPNPVTFSPKLTAAIEPNDRQALTGSPLHYMTRTLTGSPLSSGDSSEEDVNTRTQSTAQANIEGEVSDVLADIKKTLTGPKYTGHMALHPMVYRLKASSLMGGAIERFLIESGNIEAEDTFESRLEDEMWAVVEERVNAQSDDTFDPTLALDMLPELEQQVAAQKQARTVMIAKQMKRYINTWGLSAAIDQDEFTSECRKIASGYKSKRINFVYAVDGILTQLRHGSHSVEARYIALSVTFRAYGLNLERDLCRLIDTSTLSSFPLKVKDLLNALHNPADAAVPDEGSSQGHENATLLAQANDYLGVSENSENASALRWDKTTQSTFIQMCGSEDLSGAITRFVSKVRFSPSGGNMASVTLLRQLNSLARCVLDIIEHTKASEEALPDTFMDTVTTTLKEALATLFPQDDDGNAAPLLQRSPELETPFSALEHAEVHALQTFDPASETPFETHFGASLNAVPETEKNYELYRNIVTLYSLTRRFDNSADMIEVKVYANRLFDMLVAHLKTKWSIPAKGYEDGLISTLIMGHLESELHTIATDQFPTTLIGDRQHMDRLRMAVGNAGSKEYLASPVFIAHLELEIWYLGLIGLYKDGVSSPTKPQIRDWLDAQPLPVQNPGDFTIWSYVTKKGLFQDLEFTEDEHAAEDAQGVEE